MKEKKRLTAALIFGGRGLEHEVSVKGAQYVFSLIDAEKYDIIPIYISPRGRWLIQSPLDLSRPSEPDGGECFPALLSDKAGIAVKDGFIGLDVAFPLLHGDYGEDGVVQGALENAAIPYVGCDVHASAIARDKRLLKLIAKELGIRVAKWVEYTESLEETVKSCERQLSYPMFVKPAMLGSSVGVAYAADCDTLAEAIRNAAALGSDKVIIEEFIAVERELECAYFSAESKELFTSPGEIVCDVGFYDYYKKYKDAGASVNANTTVGKNISDEVVENSRRLAKKIGLRHLSRIDYFLSRDGRLYFNEINTMPGFTNGSLYSSLLEKCGISPKELINALLSEAEHRT